MIVGTQYIWQLITINLNAITSEHKYVYRVPTLAWELFDSVRGYQQDL